MCIVLLCTVYNVHCTILYNTVLYLPARTFQDTVNKLEGVISTKVNLESCEALVQHYSDTISTLAIESCINSIGKFT